MGKSSRSITLALLGSALLFVGCSSDEEEQEQDWGQNQAAGSGVRSGGVFIVPRVGGGGFGGGRVSSPGASARGGFGATGAVGAGS